MADSDEGALLMTLTAAELETWLDGYKAAWEARDPDKAAALFTEDATYQENPHEAPFIGRKGIHDYWAGVTKDHGAVEFTYRVLAVSGSQGIAHWHAELDQPSTGNHVKLDGIFVLEFAGDGLVSKLREWWHFAAAG